MERHGADWLTREARRQHGVVLWRREYKDVLAGRAWERVEPRVYRRRDWPESFEQRVMVAVLGSGGVASHRCAAALHLLDGVPRRLVEVSVPTGRNYRRHRSHRSSDLVPADITAVTAITATAVTRTLIDLGAVVDDEVVERALECAVRRSLTSPAYLDRRLDALSRLGRPGLGVVRRVLQRRQPVVTGSDLEVCFLQLLRRAGLPEPVGQYCIGPYRVDFAYPQKRRFIELDGVENHAGAAALQRDLERQNWLVGQGWVPLRFTWTDVMHHGQEVAAAGGGPYRMTSQWVHRG